MDNGIETLGLKQIHYGLSVSNINGKVAEFRQRSEQFLGLPAGITGRSEERSPHVVVNTDDLMTQRMKMSYCLRADQAA
jgi:hypothetical protein